MAAQIAEKLDPKSIPDELSHRLHQILASHKIYEKLHQNELNRLFVIFRQHAIQFILLKGTAFAYSIYPEPHLRSRGDTDLIINDKDKNKINDMLLAEGYQIYLESNARLHSYQRTYFKEDKLGFTHTLDIHWRINNRQLLAQIFSWQELIEHSTKLARLSEHVRTLNPQYQLLHACLHRVVHLHSTYHFKKFGIRGDRIIWLQDIFLLSETMTTKDWKQFSNLCLKKGVCHLVFDTVGAVSSFFPIDVPENILDNLSGHAREEYSSILLSGGLIDQFLFDFTILNWPDRLLLLREKVLPSNGYILEEYGKSSLLWLPALHIYRWISILNVFIQDMKTSNGHKKGGNNP